MKKDRLQSKSLVLPLFKFALIGAAVLLPVQSTQAVWYIYNNTTLSSNYTGQIQIMADNVTLNLNGYNVSSSGANWSIYTDKDNVLIRSNGYGLVSGSNYPIILDQCDNSDVWYINANGAYKGILLSNCTNSSVQWCNAVGQAYYGIAIENGSYNSATYCSANNCGMIGMDLPYGAHNSFYYCDANSNGLYGFRAVYTTWFTISDCNADYNGDFGYELLYSHGGLTYSGAHYNDIGFNNCLGGTSFTSTTGLTASNNYAANYVDIPGY